MELSRLTERALNEINNDTPTYDISIEGMHYTTVNLLKDIIENDGLQIVDETKYCITVTKDLE